jgi:hypothetical protein
MPADAANREELERLVAALERSGLAGTRADIATLLARSRQLLGTEPSRPVAPARRSRPPRADARRKLRSLGMLLLDAVASMGGIYGVAGLGFGTVPHVVAGPALAATLIWGLMRWGGAPALLWEGLFRIGYGLRWARLWLAEPFSDRAYNQLEALLDARDVMRGWRAHRRGLPHEPGLSDVQAWLLDTYGPRAANAFRAAREARQRRGGGWTLRGGFSTEAPRLIPEARLMRWSSLISLFEDVAAENAFWDAPLKPLSPVPQQPMERAPEFTEPAILPEGESPEHTQRRLDLRELIRKKRQDIASAYGWKLKTSAEIAQRDAYLHDTRAEIATLEQALATLGDVAPPG